MPQAPTASLNMAAISAVTAAASAAVGASYAYVDLSLHRMGASATEIGLNASMPALAWFLTTPLMPLLLRRFRPDAVLRALLLAAVLSPLGFILLPDQGAWLFVRFVFGGSLGMAFRLVEYWINAESADDRRGRNIGLYASVFCAGAAVGAGIVPITGTAGWPTILLIQGLAAAALVALSAARAAPPGITETARLSPLGLAACVPVVAALAFGLFEAVPYTLMPVHAVKAGLPEELAAGVVSAFLVGALVFPVPLGMLADSVGKKRVLAACTMVALAVPFALPGTLGTPWLLLLAMLVWGGVAGGLYTASLAMLADHFRGAELAAANVAFGTFYAAGALLGPPLHGMAMDRLEPNGIMASSAVLFAAFLGFMAWKAYRKPGQP